MALPPDLLFDTEQFTNMVMYIFNCPYASGHFLFTILMTWLTKFSTGIFLFLVSVRQKYIITFGGQSPQCQHTWVIHKWIQFIKKKFLSFDSYVGIHIFIIPPDSLNTSLMLYISTYPLFYNKIQAI